MLVNPGAFGPEIVNGMWYLVERDFIKGTTTLFDGPWYHKSDADAAFDMWMEFEGQDATIYGG